MTPLRVRLIGDRAQVDQVIKALTDIGGTWNGRHYAVRTGGRDEVRAYVEVPHDEHGDE